MIDDENKWAKRAPFIEKKRGTHTGEKLRQTTSQPRQEHEKRTQPQVSHQYRVKNNRRASRKQVNRVQTIDYK